MISLHTPGPWDFAVHPVLRVASNRVADAIAKHLGDDSCDQVMDNAILIELAPTLLDALVKVEDDLRAAFYGEESTPEERAFYHSLLDTITPVLKNFRGRD